MSAWGKTPLSSSNSSNTHTHNNEGTSSLSFASIQAEQQREKEERALQDELSCTLQQQKQQSEEGEDDEDLMRAIQASLRDQVQLGNYDVGLQEGGVIDGGGEIEIEGLVENLSQHQEEEMYKLASVADDAVVNVVHDNDDDNIGNESIVVDGIEVVGGNGEDGVSVEAVQPGTATSVPECAYPIVARATQIPNETPDEEEQSRMAGVMYADVLATAPIHPDELEEVMKAVREAEAAEERIRQQEQSSDAELARLIHSEEKDHLQKLYAKQNQNRGQFNKIQFVSSFQQENAAISETKIMDDDHYDEEDDNGMEGYRMNANTFRDNGGGSWNRASDSFHMIIGPNGERRTKHDVALKQKSNAQRLGYNENAESSGGVSDRAYNSLRSKMKKQNSHSGKTNASSTRTATAAAKANPAGARTRDGALDQAALRCIQRAINCGVLDTMHGAVNEGKEAVVYHAFSPNCERGVAVKIFKRIEQFRNRGNYVDGDPRYFGQKFHSLDKRGQLELWTEKEFRNLTRAHSAGVPSPAPIAFRENLLFMSFLGDDGWPAPQLKEVYDTRNIKQGSKRWRHLYFHTLISIRQLYHCGRLVHSDLSEYNILLCPADALRNERTAADDEKMPAKKVVSLATSDELAIAFIDFGQAVDVKHPLSQELLRRDIEKITSFFKRCGSKTIKEETAYKFVTDPLEFKHAVTIYDDKGSAGEMIEDAISEKIENGWVILNDDKEIGNQKSHRSPKKDLMPFDVDEHYAELEDIIKGQESNNLNSSTS